MNSSMNDSFGDDVIFINDTPPKEYTENGYLVVSVYTARGAIPINDALVKISYEDAERVSPHAILTTNKSGRTPKISLPAPPRDISLKPASDDENVLTLPYAVYNIEIIREGFYSVVDVGVKIFSGITAIQNNDLVPISEKLPESFLRNGKIYIDEGGGYTL